MHTIPVGPTLAELISCAYEARQPVLLRGQHGLGKSGIMAAFAKAMGIGYIELDLSVLEPPDLVGMPHVNAEGVTVYAPPAILPTSGAGVLMIEELNRAAPHMQAPCLQLLTARRINSYVLPAEWLPCAAINDGDAYSVEELDQALLSRFLNVTVVAEVGPWVDWARKHGVHPQVIAFIRNSNGVFRDPAANPRAWHKVSQYLTAWEKGARSQEVLVAGLSGFVGNKWALAFFRAYSDLHQPLEPADILNDYAVHRSTIRMWVKERKLDTVAATLEKIKQHIQRQSVYDGVVTDTDRKRNLEQFLADLPADLKLLAGDWLEDRGFTGITVKMGSKGGRS